MNKRTDMLNTLLAVILGVILLSAILVRTFAPRIILPELDIPNTVLISLLALLAEHYLAPGAKRNYIRVAALSVLTFGLLPFAACFVGAADALVLAGVGGGVFTVVTWLFTAMMDRLATGPERKAAPVVSALGLYLAAQVLAGMLV